MDPLCALIEIPTIERTIENTITEGEPFLGVAHVTSIGSFVGALLLNKKTMFLLKLRKLPSALKLLLFKV